MGLLKTLRASGGVIVGSIAAGRFSPTGDLGRVVSWLAMPVKSCANLGQLCWQYVVSSLVISSVLGSVRHWPKPAAHQRQTLTGRHPTQTPDPTCRRILAVSTWFASAAYQHHEFHLRQHCQTVCFRKRAKRPQRSGTGKPADLLNRAAGYDRWFHISLCLHQTGYWQAIVLLQELRSRKSSRSSFRISQFRAYR